jgi:hypothetical protein
VPGFAGDQLNEEDEEPNDACSAQVITPAALGISFNPNN